ncbi:hypothetical protein CXB51_004665 [Gossypium anomalum]|uniref:F-box domain-containing protein n=1 Tax=Gossypium anomalum TaxID=47600 RepID=A0A8J6DE35_9ROSI|nr:hypothetical protein CXB51_004665 [Gossypium anomalum]
MDERKGQREVMCGNLDLGALPTYCISLIISFTSPRDACRLSLVSTDFNSATESDAVWESFLPSQYQALIPLSLSFSSKKQLYLRLCKNPLLIEARRKSFWLDRGSGKKCYMLSPRDLTIIWSVDTPWYWRWVPNPDARLFSPPCHAGFDEVAELLSVAGLKSVEGLVSRHAFTHDALQGLPCIQYLVYKVGNAYGFESYPVKLSVGVVGTEANDVHFPKARVDGWLEVEMGEFFNEECVNDGELEMSALEIEHLNPKGGLILQGIEIRAMTPN